MLTGGEKYNTKQIILKINEIYPKIKELTANDSYKDNGSSLTSLYNYTLDILEALTTLTINIINSSKTLSDIFNLLQEIHLYKSVCNSNKGLISQAVEQIPALQEELINLVENDTTNRDAVLRQIMDELGIVDPNAKKKRSLW